MTLQEPLVLDFSSPDIVQIVEEYLANPFLDEYQKATLVFCQEWLSGKTEFKFQTSGSTGASTKMSVPKDKIIASVESTARYFGLKKGDEVFVCLNTQYTGGKMMLARALHLGLEAHIVSPQIDPFAFVNQSYVLTALVPNQMHQLLQKENAKEVLSRFQYIILGGAAVSDPLKKRIKEVSQTAIYETFGMTETLSHIALKRLNGVTSSNYFEVLSNVEIKVNEDHCLMVKAKVTDNEWLQTKDVVEQIDATHFLWKGRLDNVINSGGIKLNPEQIEEMITPILVEKEYSSDFFVTSLPDEVLGQRLVLVIEGEVKDKDMILEELKAKLPKYFAPKEIVCLPQLERTESGKIKRVKLR